MIAAPRAVVVGAALALAGGAAAADDERSSLDVELSARVPVAARRDLAEPGLGLSARVRVPLGPRLEATAQLGLAGYLPRTQQLAGIEVERDLAQAPVLGGIRLGFADRDRTHAFLAAEAGVVFERVRTTSAGAREVDDALELAAAVGAGVVGRRWSVAMGLGTTRPHDGLGASTATVTVGWNLLRR
ncbi:MAG: hypothetical protein R2939_04520 [Kofleriaceae bacterium]